MTFEIYAHNRCHVFLLLLLFLVTCVGKGLTVNQQYTGVGVVSVPLLWFAGLGSILFWSAVLSTIITLAHAFMFVYKYEEYSFDCSRMSELHEV